ncbi:Pectinesterase [Bertholletia excelsa]
MFLLICRRRAKLLFTLFGISALIFPALFPPTSLTKYLKTRNLPRIHTRIKTQVARSTCDGTLYPELCVSTLFKIPNLHHKSLPEIIAATVNQSVAEARASESNCSAIRRARPELDLIDKRALDDCLELLDDTIGDLRTAVGELVSGKPVAKRRREEMMTLFSAAMTNQYTCLDGFAYGRANVRPFIKDRVETISRHVSNSLALLNKIPPSKGEALPEYGVLRGGFPAWMSRRDRRLLESPANNTKWDLLVAKDGSGNFTTIEEAVAAAPNSSETRFVIYIKSGAYYENVEVGRKKTMLMFVGDGIGKTLVKGNRSVVDGWTTFRSATVAVLGTGFIAKGITFENYAGPSKHQAVALRSGADLSAFYQCSFVGYQDTLYAHSLRQFYRDCDIYGTVDFVFGNAAAVFQNCNLFARRPNPNQHNIFTAQGRTDPFQTTGFSILNCKIAAAADLEPVKSSFKTYLGRPWKEYSRTVFLLSYIGDLVEPEGWLEWSGDFALPTLYYGEYKNRGPGSNTSARVNWAGYRVITNLTEAAQFNVENLIDGASGCLLIMLPTIST